MSENKVGTPMIPASWGEVIDKITILEIKSDKLTAPAALANVRKELDLLNGIVGAEIAARSAVRQIKQELKTVNQALWDVEDDLRDKERTEDFGAEFVALARSVYRLNDQRAAHKKRLNAELASELVEEKSYRPY